jgi:hypothetical protein
LVKYWPDTGQILVKYRSVFGHGAHGMLACHNAEKIEGRCILLASNTPQDKTHASAPNRGAQRTSILSQNIADSGVLNEVSQSQDKVCSPWRGIGGHRGQHSFNWVEMAWPPQTAGPPSMPG